MKIDAYLTPYYPEREDRFKDKIVIMLDVFRSSASVCAALCAGAKEIIPAETIERAATVFGMLDRDIRFLGGERKGMKLNNFDAGNSPAEYTAERVGGKTIVLTTTNGAMIYQRAKDAKARFIASFVNKAILLETLEKNYLNDGTEGLEIVFLCAGTDGRVSYEDSLAAGCFIDAL